MKSGFSYQSAGVLLAAEIIERISGVSLRDFEQKEIFDPLGMTNAGWGVQASHPDLLPMYEYSTVEMTPGKPWTLYQRDPTPAAQLDLTNNDAVAKLQQCVLPDAQGTGKVARCPGHPRRRHPCTSCSRQRRRSHRTPLAAVCPLSCPVAA